MCTIKIMVKVKLRVSAQDALVGFMFMTDYVEILSQLTRYIVLNYDKYSLFIFCNKKHVYIEERLYTAGRDQVIIMGWRHQKYYSTY